MSKGRKYRGTVWVIVIRVFVYGILAGCVLEILSLLALSGLPYDLPYGLYRIMHWPNGLLWGIFVSAVIVLLRWTTVEIDQDRICVRRIGFRRCFEPSDFLDSFVKRKTHIGSYSKYTTVKCYLLFAAPDGIMTCRLYGFGEKELEKVLEAIRNMQAKHLPEEEKAAIVKEYEDEVSEALIQGRESENEFLLPVSDLIRREKNFLKKISLVAAVIVVLIGVIDAFEIFVRQTFSIRLLFMTVLGAMLLVFIIAMYVGLGRKRRRCAERIVIDGDHLQIGRHYYSYAGIESVRLTSPRKRSSSVFPVQRYLYIHAVGKTTKYWLGSEVSFEAYESLCRSLERGMVLYPDRLRYM